MSTVLGSHAAFLAVAIATHAAVGYAIGLAAFDRPRAGLLAGVAADVDLLVPENWPGLLVHRGITHSALALVIAVAAVAVATRDRSTAAATGFAYASQLVIDATTPMGVPLLLPVSSAYVGVTLGGHSPVATVLLWCLAGSLVWYDRCWTSGKPYPSLL